VLVPPSRAMCKVWVAGLVPNLAPPANFALLEGLWQAQNLAFTTEWLRLLRRQSASTMEEGQQLRRSELSAAADRARLDAINRFYGGKELQRLLHPKPPAPHSPLLAPRHRDTDRWQQRPGFPKGRPHRFRGGADRDAGGSLVSSQLHWPVSSPWLTGSEQEGLSTELDGRERLVQGVADRLCTWESELAVEAKATKARCASSRSKLLMPVTQSSDQPSPASRTVRWWCIQCSGFRSLAVDVDEYEILPFRLDDIPRVPPRCAGDPAW
jgi:hypothetical protein